MKIPRVLKWVLGVAGALLGLFAVFIGLTAWWLSNLIGEPSKDEVDRVVSPTGKFDAVLFETNGGATASFGYDVYVVPHESQVSGAPAMSLYGTARSRNAYGANLKWESADSLVVQYLNTRKETVNSPNLRFGDQIIRLSSQAGISDDTAPPGGMLYNLRGRPHDRQ
jgi:hypothetical protein